MADKGRKPKRVSTAGVPNTAVAPPIGVRPPITTKGLPPVVTVDPAQAAILRESDQERDQNMRQADRDIAAERQKDIARRQQESQGLPPVGPGPSGGPTTSPVDPSARMDRNMQIAIQKQLLDFARKAGHSVGAARIEDTIRGLTNIKTVEDQQQDLIEPRGGTFGSSQGGTHGGNAGVLGTQQFMVPSASVARPGLPPGALPGSLAQRGQTQVGKTRVHAGPADAEIRELRKIDADIAKLIGRPTQTTEISGRKVTSELGASAALDAKIKELTASDADPVTLGKLTALQDKKSKQLEIAKGKIEAVQAEQKARVDAIRQERQALIKEASELGVSERQYKRIRAIQRHEDKRMDRRLMIAAGIKGALSKDPEKLRRQKMEMVEAGFTAVNQLLQIRQSIDERTVGPDDTKGNALKDKQLNEVNRQIESFMNKNNRLYNDLYGITKEEVALIANRIRAENPDAPDDVLRTLIKQAIANR